MIYKLIAFSQLIIAFTLIPILMHQIWPRSSIENKLIFQVFSQQFVHIIVYVVVNSYYFVFYTINHPSVEKYKVEKVTVRQQQAPWPWQTNAKEWIIKRNQTIVCFLYNILLGILVSLIFSWRRIANTIEYEDFPPISQMIWQCIFNMIAEDFLFYWTHRALHHPSLYFIHKQHHTYSITGISLFDIVSISAEYAHPIEYIFGNILPVAIGPILLGSSIHLSTYLLWIGLGVYKTLSGHSGYVFPWEPFQYLPNATQGEFHSFHHSQNIGNYGSAFRFWDYIFGTSEQYFNQKYKKSYGIIKYD